MKKKYSFFKDKALEPNEKPNHFSDWVLRNAFELLVFPVTILAVIFGIYGQVIHKRLHEIDKNENYSKIATYQEYFRKEKKRSTEIDTQEIYFDQDTTKYNHMLIIDRTYSGVNPTLNKTTKTLQDSLKVRLKNHDVTDAYLQSKKSVKSLVTIDFLSDYFEDEYATKNICLAFYDGGGEDFNFPRHESLAGKRIKIWRTVTKENNYDFLGFFLSQNLDVVQKRNQITDFRDVFKNIPKYATDKENLIITIISDFNHELSDINEFEINELISKNKIKKINILYVPPDNSKDLIKSKKLLKIITNNYDFNDFLNFKQINIKDFEYINTNDDWKEYLISRGSFLSMTRHPKDPVIFYYPIYNKKSDAVKRVNLKIKDSSGIGLGFEWKISDKENTAKKFAGTITSKNNEKRNFSVNKFYSSKNDSLNLIIDLYDEIQSDRLELYLYDLEKNKSQTHNIIFIELIPEIISKIALICLSIIKYSLLVIFILHLWRSLKYLNFCKNKALYISLGEILFIAISITVSFCLLNLDWYLISLICICGLHLLLYGLYGLNNLLKLN